MPFSRDAARLGDRLGVAPATLRITGQPSTHEQTQSGQAAKGQQGETRLQHCFGLR
jgi:hypothetical protein